MKITVYTISDCQFSKQEKEYLTTNKFQFEEKNLETNKDWLTEMLVVSNNFAGTPVTKVEKDDGQILVLKGFTREEFDKALGLAPQTPIEDKKPETTPAVQAEQKIEEKTDATVAPVVNPAQPAVPPTTSPTPANPAANAVIDQPAQTTPAAAPVSETPTANQSAPDPLNAVLEDLQAKVKETETKGTMPPAPASTSTPPAADTPTGLPKIPDFQNTT